MASVLRTKFVCAHTLQASSLLIQKSQRQIKEVKSGKDTDNPTHPAYSIRDLACSTSGRGYTAQNPSLTRKYIPA